MSLPNDSASNPKPPTIIENLRWLKQNWRSSIGYIVLAMVLYVVYEYYQFHKPPKPLSVTAKTESDDKNLTLTLPTLDYGGCIASSPSGDPPILVKFVDGSEAYVNFGFSVHRDIRLSLDAATRFDKPIDAYDALTVRLVGTVYAVLERRTQNFARTNRKLLADEVLKLAKPFEIETAFVIDHFSFLNVCSPKWAKDLKKKG
jgi:hypothetical protein